MCTGSWERFSLSVQRFKMEAEDGWKSQTNEVLSLVMERCFRGGILICQHINALTHYPHGRPRARCHEIYGGHSGGERHRRPETGGRKKTRSARHTCKQNPPKTGLNRLEKHRKQHNLGMRKLNMNSH